MFWTRIVDLPSLTASRSVIIIAAIIISSGAFLLPFCLFQPVQPVLDSRDVNSNLDLAISRFRVVRHNQIRKEERLTLAMTNTNEFVVPRVYYQDR